MILSVLLVSFAAQADPTRSVQVSQPASTSATQPVFRSVQLPPSYRPYSYVDATVTGIFGVAAIVAPILGPRDSGISGGLWFDDSIRSAMRARTFSGRLRADDASDVTLGLSVTYGLFVDPWVNASWARRSPDVGLQMGLVNLEVFAITAGLQQLFANGVGRERPYGDVCDTDELYNNTHTCHERDRYRSFFSGHTSVAFSMAAVTCVHHTQLNLSVGSPWVACGSAFAVAAFTGAMRVVSDNHYATDVSVGALVGTGVGLLVPLLHYSVSSPAGTSSTSDLQLWVLPAARGVTLGGIF